MSSEQGPTWHELTAAIAAAEADGGTVGVAAQGPTGGRFAHNGARPFRAASTVKVPLLIELLRQIEDGVFAIDDQYTLERADKTPGSGVLQDLHDGLTLTYRDLIYLMISISDNTATNILIDRAGMDDVNTTMRELGMMDSILGRKMRGRPAGENEGENWATPNDYLLALRAIVGSSFVSDAGRAFMRTMLEKQQNSRRIARYLPERPGITWGSKTGSLVGVANDVGFISTPRGTLLLSIFTEEIATSHAAERAIGMISRAALLDTGLVEPLPLD